MSATASEGLIQCRSGTWASASQTVGSGGSLTPITAIMQYEKTLVTTVDACTDAMVGFKGFNPQNGRTMVCGGASFGWRPEITAGLSVREKCGLITSGGTFSFTRTEISTACGDVRPACVVWGPRVLTNNGGLLPLAWFSSNQTSANEFCKQIGLSNLNTACGNFSYSGGWTSGQIAILTGDSWQNTSGDGVFSQAIPCE